MDERRAERAVEGGSLKGRFPFRLGTTSYIIQDDVVPNVEFLADKVDDIELVLFESDEMSNMPDDDALDRLCEIAVERDLTYTVHLPLDADITSLDEGTRVASVGKCRRTIDLTRRLEPFAWVLHVNGERKGGTPAEDVEAWRDRAMSSIEGILAEGPPPSRICIETLAYGFEFLRDIIRESGASVCMDIGHVMISGQDLNECMAMHLDRTRVVHLHGVIDGRDHRGLDVMPPELLKDLCRRFTPQEEAERVVTIEVFGRGELERSLKALEEVPLWERSR